MTIPLQVTVRDISDTEAIEQRIRQKTDKLEQFCDRIMSCRVVIEVPQKHKHQGKLYAVRIDVLVPQKELVVNRVLNEDLYVAIRDAFKAIRRQLESYTRIKRGDIKSHQDLKHGEVVKLFLEEGYGFIETPDGSEYYFASENVLHPTFNQLLIGTSVQFLETEASDGLQAVKVIIEQEG